MSTATADKYLARYAEPESELADKLGSYSAALVVPVRDERATLLSGLRAALSAVARPLVIFVVNADASCSARVRANNRQLVADLCALGPVRVLSQQPPAHIVDAGFAELLILDRSTDATLVDSSEAVGRARKIGCDVALRLWARDQLSNRWIHTTDADVALPADYFPAAAQATADAVLLAYPFWHDSDWAADLDEPLDETDQLAADLYEISLRYYTLGLRAARSPYAFHTVGSTLAVESRAYAAVRGVPARAGGEDFYLANKLAKVGAVQVPDVAPIRIRARRSARVPFGTGPATRRIADDVRAGGDLKLYHPDSFTHLATWLALIRDFSRHPDERPLAAVPAGPLRTALEALGAGNAVVDASERTSAGAALERRLHDWFDAFRTLKLIHHMRDHGLLPMIPWRQALAGAGLPGAQMVPVDARRALFERELGRKCC